MVLFLEIKLVNKSVLENEMIAAVPGEVISHNGSGDYIVNTECLYIGLL